MVVKKARHCAYQTHYHLVFPVKYRKALLSSDITETILEISKAVSERYEIEFEQIGCDKDHIHILVSCPPTLAPSTNNVAEDPTGFWLPSKI